MKTCVLIPNYNHSKDFLSLLSDLAPYDLDCVVVDDGSSLEHQKNIQAACAKFKWVEYVKRNENGGKGAAVMTGLEWIHDKGYSHALQIDADGQHDLGSIPKLLDKSKEFPEDLISGKPVYNESIPFSRNIGRYVTHIWVWIETLNTGIKDSMCGFRVYPVARACHIFSRKKIGRRMDFDIEVMVRLYWSGVNCHFVDVKVIYPENGVSHFQVWRDNCRITWMHTKLFFEMLPQLPKLWVR